VDAVGNLARQAADALHNRRSIIGQLAGRQQRYDLGLVLPHPRQQVAGNGSGADSRSMSPSSPTVPPASVT
jgi:hypothetical protein